MKALVWHARKDLRYEDFPEPEVGTNEIKIKVKYAGLCHTDFTEYSYGPIYLSAEPHPRTGRGAPIVLGHEFSGEVVEIGSNVKRITVGDRVCVNACDPCLDCYYCRRGLYAVCQQGAFIGFNRDGGFAEYTVVPEWSCHRLPDSASYQLGALIEPLSVGMHALKRAEISVGDRVAIVGGGTIGLCTLQCAKAAGASQIYVLEKSEVKEKFARDLGATEVINPGKVDPVEAVFQLTDGIGVDLAIECVGVEATAKMCVDIIRKQGIACLVGIFTEPFEYNFNDLMSGEKSLVTSLGYGDEFPIVLSLLADGRMDPDAIITGTLPLAQGVTEGLDKFEERGATAVKTLLEIGA